MAVNRGSFLIMRILHKKAALDEVQSMTLNEIQAIEQTSKINTIHKWIKDLIPLGWVAEGYKSGRSKAYYLTETGIQKLKVNNKKEIDNTDVKE